MADAAQAMGFCCPNRVQAPTLKIQPRKTRDPSVVQHSFPTHQHQRGRGSEGTPTTKGVLNRKGFLDNFWVSAMCGSCCPVHTPSLEASMTVTST